MAASVWIMFSMLTPLSPFSVRFTPLTTPTVTVFWKSPNAEPMAWSMHCSALSAESRGNGTGTEDALWLAGGGSEIVYFLGFDNIYPFAIAGPAMLLAFDGRYELPTRYLTNEFYELDHRKFSTSRGHVVWGRELAAEVPRDLIRFHLASTSPEHQRTSFSRDGLVRVTESRLVGPWNRIADRVGQWAGRALPVSERSRRAAARIVDRFAACYELDGFSLNRPRRRSTTRSRARRPEGRPGPRPAPDNPCSNPARSRSPARSTVR